MACRAWSMACWVFLGRAHAAAGLAHPAIAHADAVHGGLAGAVPGGVVEGLGFGAIANAAHLGGLLGGAVLGVLFGMLSAGKREDE